jgi:hypothetical protein
MHNPGSRRAFISPCYRATHEKALLARNRDDLLRAGLCIPGVRGNQAMTNVI